MIKFGVKVLIPVHQGLMSLRRGEVSKFSGLSKYFSVFALVNLIDFFLGLLFDNMLVTLAFLFCYIALVKNNFSLSSKLYDLIFLEILRDFNIFKIILNFADKLNNMLDQLSISAEPLKQKVFVPLSEFIMELLFGKKKI